jgi:hypothetical protein
MRIPYRYPVTYYDNYGSFLDRKMHYFVILIGFCFIREMMMMMMMMIVLQMKRKTQHQEETSQIMIMPQRLCSS